MGLSASEHVGVIDPRDSDGLGGRRSCAVVLGGEGCVDPKMVAKAGCTFWRWMRKRALRIKFDQLNPKVIYAAERRRVWAFGRRAWFRDS